MARDADIRRRTRRIEDQINRNLLAPATTLQQGYAIGPTGYAFDYATRRGWDPLSARRKGPHYGYRHPYIHRHHDWYRGGWSRHRGKYWYSPYVFASYGWGLNVWVGTWGYGYGYAYTNPYCSYASPSLVTIYDYTLPLYVPSYRAPVADASIDRVLAFDSDLTPTERQSLELFEEARAAFRRVELANALRLTERAVQLSPEDLALHEFYAVVLFSLRRYDDAAAVLHSLLAVTPGMDWSAMNGLYESPETYTTHLRLLESHISKDPEDTPAMFVLAYHYLVLGETEASIEALRLVVESNPDDKVSSQLLRDLSGEAPPVEPPATDGGRTRRGPKVITPSTTADVLPTPVEPDVDTPTLPEPRDIADDSVIGTADIDVPGDESTKPTTNWLVGGWIASQGEQEISLRFEDNGKFQWTIKSDEEAPREISGAFTLANDILVLESGDAGTFVGKIDQAGRAKFRYRLLNAPADDPGLNFNRDP